jgi:hypothetical protein
MAKLDLPFSIEAPDKKSPAKMMPDAGAADMQSEEIESAGGIPGYIEPWTRCANCEYFSPDDSMCRKFNKNCDMDGACPSFEEAGEDTEEGGGEEEPESPGGMEEEGEGDD